MECRIREIRNKEVVNICDGCRLGFVGDLEIRMPEGTVCALIVPGPFRFFGLWARGEDYYIPWDCIRKIGSDIILIEKEFPRAAPPRERKRGRRL